MSEDKEAFLNRWSRLKKQQAEPVEKKPETPAPTNLPPVDKLTPESDFTGFMHPKVADALRRTALKKLFSDPHFNVPDPFEPYSRDWNVSDPIPEAMRASLEQWKTLTRPPPQEAAPKETIAQDDAPGAVAPEPKPDEPGKQDA